jgi:hypothetical protein
VGGSRRGEYYEHAHWGGVLAWSALWEVCRDLEGNLRVVKWISPTSRSVLVSIAAMGEYGGLPAGDSRTTYSIVPVNFIQCCTCS